MSFLSIHGIILLALLSYTSLPQSCVSDSRLLPNKPLTAGSKLTSDDGTFALGFFSPSNSTKKHYYVGIWYNNIPKDNIVWVANRATPITDPSSATLALTNGSNLVVSNTNGQLLWMANIDATRNFSSDTTSGEATLDNSGNFILRASNGVILWQSFDYPTDTLLPGMNIRLTHNSHPLQRLISWKGPQDPSPGSFSYGADPNEFLQRFIWNGSRPYWRSPVWNNYLVVGTYMDIIKSTIYLTRQRVDDEIVLSFGIPGDSSTVKFKMDYLGKMEILIWNNSKMSEWNIFLAAPNECGKYGYCGPFGYCDNTESIATCKCLDGFEPIKDKDRTTDRFSGGCRRKDALRCGQENSFLTLTNMKVPDMFLYVKNRSFDECRAECTSNCSCTAYAYANMSTTAINGDDTRCLLWVGNLIDIEKFPITQGENLYIRVNRLSDKTRRKIILKFTLPIVSSLFILICMWLVWIYNCQAKQRNKKILKKLMFGALSTSNELGDGNIPFFSYRDIVLATNNFCSSNMLGHGGFGNVYKGTLGYGKKIAVKRLSKSSGQGLLEFRNEVILIAKLQHRNLVKLLGFCIHGDEKLLIYEYLPNKSLDAFLFDPARKPLLDWSIRFKIIIGIARGLLYLHQDSRLKIIHRDLKASNILLDEEMSPKISDFGMARIFYGSQQQGNTNRVVGTFGYMSPEYALEGVFSVKSDVYSFGVLILEIVNGSKISSAQVSEDFSNLIAFAWSLWKDGNTENFTDSSIAESCALDEASQCIHIGLLCVQNNPNDRPLMSSVVSILENGTTSLPPPKQPIYFAERNYGTYGAAETILSCADTITVLEGR